MIENRKSYRVPFRRKFVFSTPNEVLAGNCLNISSGGVFILTMESEKLKRDMECRTLFGLDDDEEPIAIDCVVRRIVQRTSNPEDIPGAGFAFKSVTDKQGDRIANYMERLRKKYELAATLVMSGEPDRQSLQPLLKSMFVPSYSDLGELQFYIERILRAIELVDRAPTP